MVFVFVFCLIYFCSGIEYSYKILKTEVFEIMDKKVIDLMNDQINKEFYSAYLYLDFANYYTDEGLDGFANWYKVQAQEERDHAMLFAEFLQNNGIKVSLKAIDAPDVPIKKHADALKASFKHEQYVTALIHKIYDVAFSKKDYRSMQFLDWFVKEQGEEEKNAEEMIRKYELYGSDAKGLYALNEELKARVYSPPGLVLD